MLRETKTLFGKHKLGYLWVFIQAAFTISIFWGIRTLGGPPTHFGLATPVFLLAGFSPWFLVSESVAASVNAIGGNRALLSYPQVFPIDLLIARTLLIGATYFCVMVLWLLVIRVFGYVAPLQEPAKIFLALAMAVLLGFGAGAIGSSLNLILPTTARIVPILLRILFFTSGLFFSVSELPLRIQHYLSFNPILHIIELTRSGFSSTYPANFVSLGYISGWVMAVLAIGLLLERYSRKYIGSET
jgi:capsular polysaccharide transport system permease protein